MNKKPFVTVHRGGGNYAPENTLYAIKKGMEFPVDAIEFDVRFTKDHIPVVLHDQSLKRTTLGKHKILIQNVNYKDVQSYNVTSWYNNKIPKETLPTLEEALQLLKGKKQVFIELKAHDPYLGQTIKEILLKYDMVQDVYILSFYKDILYEVKKHLPEVKTTFIFSRWRKPYQELVDPMFDTIGPKFSYLYRHPKLKTFLQQQKIEIYPWSVNKKRIINKFIQWGITGITSDKPDLVLDCIQKQSTKR